MIQPLFMLLITQMALTLLLSFANPIRKLVVKGLDLSKQGRGPLVTKTVAATMLVVFSSTVYTITEIKKRIKDTGIVNPTDEVLMAYRLLEAFFLGKLLQKLVPCLLTIPVLLFLLHSITMMLRRVSEVNIDLLIICLVSTNTDFPFATSSGILSAEHVNFNPVDYLAGFSLFLGLVIDRQHYYIREINLLRRSLETAKKQNLSPDSSKRRAAVPDK